MRIVFPGLGEQCSSLRTAVKGQHVSENDNFLFWGRGRVSLAQAGLALAM